MKNDLGRDEKMRKTSILFRMIIAFGVIGILTSCEDKEVNTLNDTSIEIISETAITTIEKNDVVDSAKSSLNYSPSSYQELIEYLEEIKGFSYEDAVYGADYCGADWNEQAAKLIEVFLGSSSSSLSQEELIRILEKFGFTHEQAVYGAKTMNIENDKESKL